METATQQPVEQRKELVCHVCGYRWYTRAGADDPLRCARASCRSKRWRGPDGQPVDRTGTRKEVR